MANNEAESPKWVTFHDGMDDAMEGGKLLPIKRRLESESHDKMSFKSQELQFKFGSLTSSLSSSSLDEVFKTSTSPPEPKNSFDFSQSLGFGEEKEIQRRRKPEQHRRSTLASLSGSPLASQVSCGGGGGIAVSGCNGDKYKIFSVLDKSPGAAKGWSGKVRVGHAQSPMGWSDEVLGVGSDEEEIELDYTSSESIPAMALPENRPQSLSVQSDEPTEPWQISLHRNTWDRSPNRSFIRNFP